MIHVYAFVEGLERLPDRDGVEGAALEGVRACGIAAVASRHAAAPAGDPREGAVAHGLVVEALRVTAESVLPVRFGESFAGDAELRDAVSAGEQRIRAALELVRGCVEIGVRLSRTSAPVTVPSGRAYLEARLAQGTIVSALDDRLAPFARASSESSGERAYLVESGAARAAVDAVAEFAEAHRDVSIVCTGPWAPYSFGEVRT